MYVLDPRENLRLSGEGPILAGKSLQLIQAWCFKIVYQRGKIYFLKPEIWSLQNNYHTIQNFRVAYWYDAVSYDGVARLSALANMCASFLSKKWQQLRKMLAASFSLSAISSFKLLIHCCLLLCWYSPTGVFHTRLSLV